MKNSNTAYDDFPYKSSCFPLTSPVRVKTIFNLLSMETPNLEKARILEIGCSFGGNLIPFALEFPNSSITGIDLSNFQIEEGKKILNTLKIKNINLISQDIKNFKTDQQFDYIICHGVFSWVDTEVKKSILELIKNNLVSNGVAIISYNTYPGWKELEILKDAMNFRANYVSNLIQPLSHNETIKVAKGIIEFLHSNSNLSETIKRKEQDILSQSSHYLYHEFFETINTPMYLVDFENMLNEYGLHHRVDSELLKSYPGYLPKETLNDIENECGDNNIFQEQYYDFLSNQQFRVSLITHKDFMPSVKTKPNFLNLDKVYIRACPTFNDNQIFFGDRIKIPANEIFTTIANKFLELYPNFSTIDDFTSSFPLENKTEICNSLGELILYNCIDFSTHHFEIDNENIKISPAKMRYLKYTTEKNMYIDMGTFDNHLIKFNNDIIPKILMLCNKNYDDEQLKRKIITYLENTDIEKDSIESLATILLKECKNFIPALRLNM